MWDIFRIFTPMKEQVTDISKVLQDMTAEMRLMRETINQQYAEIAKLNRNIEALNRQIRKKDEENARLKERLSKYEKPKKNSGNSSTPPSKETMKDEIVRRTKVSANQVERSQVDRKVMTGTNYPALLRQTR